MLMMMMMIYLGGSSRQSICKGRIGSARNKGGHLPNVKTSWMSVDYGDDDDDDD